MRVLFTVQGEGRGHLTQAITLRALLEKQGHEVIGVIVGKSSARQLPDFFTARIQAPLYTVESPNFLPPRKKTNRPPLLRSIAYNVMRAPRFRSGVNLV